MKKVFKYYHKLLTDRCDNIPLLKIGEDSIRYDFFIAISKMESLKPYEIKLECAMDKKTYIPRNNSKATRKENPQMDLVIDKNNICVEFGLFRQNSNVKANINKTFRLIKMLNDMIRLGLETHYTKRKGYFICVADSKMLNHQLKSKAFNKFPSDYIISKDAIDKVSKLKISNLDTRFIKKMNELKLSFKANIIYDEEIKAKKINLHTRVLIWKINVI